MLAASGKYTTPFRQGAYHQNRTGKNGGEMNMASLRRDRCDAAVDAEKIELERAEAFAQARVYQSRIV
jgi:hypothetical protein